MLTLLDCCVPGVTMCKEYGYYTSNSEGHHRGYDQWIYKIQLERKGIGSMNLKKVPERKGGRRGEGLPEIIEMMHVAFKRISSVVTLESGFN